MQEKLQEAASGRIRQVRRTLRGMPASDGAGVRLTRVIGQPMLPDLDPFLLLDEFRSDDARDYIAGFPDHPHRGFETVTYMLAGRMRHGDNKGNTGLLRAGSVQWMTAGRGIVHSEMPEQEDGLMWGFQLWINLPAARKMTEPRYQDIEPEAIPEVQAPGGVTVRVVVGRYGDTVGPVEAPDTDPSYLDLHMPAGTTFNASVPAGHTSFIYVYDGAVEAGPDGAVEPLRRGEIGVLGDGEHVRARAGAEPARLLLLAGRPLNEPVARYGPFVMNTREELQQAVTDFQAGRF